MCGKSRFRVCIVLQLASTFYFSFFVFLNQQKNKYLILVPCQGPTLRKVEYIIITMKVKKADLTNLLKLNKQIKNSETLVIFVMRDQAGMKHCPYYIYCNKLVLGQTGLSKQYRPRSDAEKNVASVLHLLCLPFIQQCKRCNKLDLFKF